MKPIQLSPHFQLDEFTRSNTASTLGIDNVPSIAAISNLQQLCIHVLEPLRAHAARPINISSGYRSESVNRAVGGATNSQHLTGEAADISIPDEATGREWMKWLQANCPFHQLIWERASPRATRHWIHVSYRQDAPNRHQVIDELVRDKT